MKKRFLPFNFFLGFLSLSITVFGFNNDGEKKIDKKTSVDYTNIKGTDYMQVVRPNQNTGLINYSDVLNAKLQAAKLNEIQAKEDLNWVTIGPDNFGGRTRAVIYDNQDASGKTIYAGAVTGGLWKSPDNGITWDKINTEGANLYVSCMFQTNDGTIYVGTGELFGANRASMFEELGYTTGFMGSGLYKSTDGNNFELIASTQPEVGNTDDEWAFILEVQVDQNGRIYAATNAGLKYSDDNGQSWNYAKDVDGNALQGVSTDVKVGSNVVLVTVDNNCYVSNGDANSFVNLSTGEENKLPVADELSRVEFAVAPTDNTIVYASLIKTNGNLYGIYRSENSGADWSVVLPGSASFDIFMYGGFYYNTLVVFPDDPNKVLLGGANLWVGYKTNDTGLFFWEQKSTFASLPYLPDYVPFGHHAYAFRPGHPNEFMIGTSSGLYSGKITGNEYVYKDANKKYYTTQFYSVGTSGLENYVVGGTNENSVIIMDQQSNSTGYGRLVLGYQQGYLLTTNGGDAAVSLINPDKILVGSAYGRVYRSEDRGQNYSVNFKDGVEFNEGFYTPFALWESFNNENSRDSVWFYAGANTYTGGTTLTVKSSNSDYPFKYTLPDDVTLNPGDSILVQDPVSSRVFLAAKNHVYMTKDFHKFAKTAEWFEIANSGVGYVGTANALAYSADANHLFVGTTEGQLYRISNLALAYNKELADVNEPTCIVAVDQLELIDPETGNPVTQAITSISVDPQSPEKVLVTLGNYGNKHFVFYTTNALAQNPTFVSKQGNLPKMPVYSSIIEMKDNKLVIIGTDMGVYMTSDITADNVEWMPAMGDMGKVPVLDLKQQTVAQKPVTLDLGGDVIEFPGATNYGIIYAGTYGRGILRCNDYRQPVGIGEHYSDNGNTGTIEVKVFPNPVNELLHVNFKAQENADYQVAIFDLSGKQLYHQITSVKKGDNNLTIRLANLKAGTYLLMINNGSTIATQKIVKH